MFAIFAAVIATTPTADVVAARVEAAVLSPARFTLNAHIRTEGSFNADIRTKWRWAPKSRALIQIDGRLLGAEASARFVSTGALMQWPGNLVRVAEDLDRGSRLMLVRLGASFNALRIASGTLPDGLDGSGHYFARWTNVQLGAPERIGRRRCLPLQFTMLVADESIGTGTLWVDARTYLPVQREMRVSFNQGTMHVIERYTKVGARKTPFPSRLFKLL
ncbi:MAG: hypothetical protein AAF449_13425 [Myxococcota bacterium]